MAKRAFSAADAVLPPLTGPRILLYHQVGTSLDRQMEVEETVFRDQLDWIAGKGSVASLEEAIDRRGDPDSSSLFCLTFDDGYSDVYEKAFPLMRERRWPFTIYLTTRPIESQNPLAPGATPLSWDQINEMNDSSLLTVGAHTHTHLDVRSATRDQLAEELATSDQLIKDRTGVSPRHFAYPWGLWSRDAEELIQDRYQSAALASVVSMVPDTSPLRLPRIPIQKADGVRFFRKKVEKGLRAEDWARRLVKRYSVPSSTGSSRRSVPGVK